MIRLLAVVRRRWLTMALGLAATLIACYFVSRDDGVYWTRTSIVFLAPSSAQFPNSLKTESEDVIITAGIVAKLVNGPGEVVKYASTEATLVGIASTGQDYWLRLPDTGGQWAPHFTDQLLYLDAIGGSVADVERTVDEVSARVSDALDALQRAHGVDQRNDITVTVVPSPPAVEYVDGSRTRAVGMSALLGLSGTVVAGALMDRRSGRHREARFPAGSREPPLVH